MIVKMQCPNCSAGLEIDDSREVMYCTYCGTKLVNLPHIIKMDRSNEPNLIVDFHSTDKQVVMVLRHDGSEQKSVFTDGQKMTFRLEKGVHTITMKIGGRSYQRVIAIPDDNAPVSIYASWAGQAHITVDQPKHGYDLKQTESKNAAKSKSGLWQMGIGAGIIAAVLVLSLQKRSIMLPGGVAAGILAGMGFLIWGGGLMLRRMEK